MRISDWSSDVCSSDLRDPRWGPGLDAVDLQADVLFPVGRLASVACADEIAVAAVAHRGNPRRRRRVADQLRRAGAEPGRRQEAFSHCLLTAAGPTGDLEKGEIGRAHV